MSTVCVGVCVAGKEVEPPGFCSLQRLPAGYCDTLAMLAMPCATLRCGSKVPGKRVRKYYRTYRVRLDMAFLQLDLSTLLQLALARSDPQ